MRKPAGTRSKATKAAKPKARSAKTAKAKRSSGGARRTKSARSAEAEKLAKDKPAKKASRSTGRASAAKKSAKKNSRKSSSSKARKTSKPARSSKSRVNGNDPIPTLELVSSETPEAPVSSAKPRRLSKRRARTLLELESALSERIVGKDDAIEKIARVVRVRMTQLDFRPERPNGSFLLVGPSGVGKNEFAYALSEVLFGSEDRVVSVDLGEFDDEDDLAKLGPSPVPGVEGHFFEGVLTSPVRKDPNAILLLRGIERAHPAFQRLLAQILDTGSVEDMLGAVDFRQTIIFVTHHVSREETTPGEIGFSRPSKSAEALRREQLEMYVLARPARCLQ